MAEKQRNKDNLFDSMKQINEWNDPMEIGDIIE